MRLGSTRGTDKVMTGLELYCVSEATDVAKETVLEYIETDFGGTPPDVEELVEHINYQESLAAMSNDTSGRDFDELWCEHY